MGKVYFPAKFSDSIIDALDELVVVDDDVERGYFLDPFAGVGGVMRLANTMRRIIAIEIEPAFAKAYFDCPISPYGEFYIGDSTKPETYRVALRELYGRLDGIITSPTYGNRFADHHKAKDGSTRRSYTHDLRRTMNDPDANLDDNNSGLLHWGKKYREFHEQVYRLWLDVLKPGGKVYLNVSDFIKDRKVVKVSPWHHGALLRAGFEHEGLHLVETPRLRYGKNSELRVDHEKIIVVRKRTG